MYGKIELPRPRPPPPSKNEQEIFLNNIPRMSPEKDKQDLAALSEKELSEA